MQNKIYEVQKVEVGLGRKLIGAYSVDEVILTCYSITDLANLFDVREKDVESMLQSRDLKEYIKARNKDGCLFTYFDEQDDLVLPLFKIRDKPEYIKLVEEEVFMGLCLLFFNIFKEDTKTILVAGFLESMINKVHDTTRRIHEAVCQGLDTSDIIGGGIQSRSSWEYLNSLFK